MPRSTAFFDYATGPRAKALLSVSLEWWTMPGCHALHYEDLVAQTSMELTKLTQALGVAPVTSVEMAMSATTLPKLRQLTKNNNHFWQGQSNLWKKLLTAAEATPIAAGASGGLREARLPLRSESRNDSQPGRCGLGEAGLGPIDGRAACSEAL